MKGLLNDRIFRQKIAEPCRIMNEAQRILML